MARVLVVGSMKSHDPVEFQEACRAIRAALARRGHVIVAAGCGDHAAETWVLDGGNSAQPAHRKTRVIPFAPALPGTQELIVQTPGVSARWPHLLFEAPFETKGPWAVGQAVALIRSDVALLIGGGELTANVGSLALELEKPYYAVSALGGTAELIAGQDYAKHRAMGMPDSWPAARASQHDFGDNVVKATEFVVKHCRERSAIRSNSIVLAVSLVLLAAFLGFLFRHDPLGNEAQVVYTTGFGAVVGVMLAFLTGRVSGGETVRASSVLGQISLACFLGVLYGFFALHAGSFYKVDVAKWPRGDVDSLANQMALVGVGVGALPGPASRGALEKLRGAAKLKDE